MEKTKKLGDWWIPSDCPYFKRFAQGRSFDFLTEGYFGSYDKAMTYVTDKSVAVDGGTHIGTWLFRMMADFDFVLGFEPDDVNWECLTKNIEERNPPYFAYQVEKFAIGEKPDTGRIQRAENSGAGYVQPGDAFAINTIDSYRLESCGLIKLDVEGYEYYALKGAEETIEKFHPVIMFEDKGLEEKYYSVPVGECHKFLCKHGYEKVDHINRDSIYVFRGE